MTTHRDSRSILAPAERVFDLVADVERYPEFLSLWRQARVFRRDGNVYYTHQEIGLGPVRERFHTRTELIRPERIDITSRDTMFRSFLIRWDFTDEDTGCRASVMLDWQMRSKLLQKAIDALLPSAAQSMVGAFQRRAEQTLR
ncbi:MAG: type II toxin-antitoxin system RatA family toxin [Rhodospirillales bacterium]|nr:type II toxin-antitoxin system RatA family toxin [Rhodospirillales bacterium]